jgi:hypothetical protein
LKLTEEFRKENLLDGPWMVDVLQVKLTALHAYMNIQKQCSELAESQGSYTTSANDSEDHAMVIDDSPCSENGDHRTISSPVPILNGGDTNQTSNSMINVEDDHMLDAVDDMAQDIDLQQSNSSGIMDLVS